MMKELSDGADLADERADSKRIGITLQKSRQAVGYRDFFVLCSKL